jgi:hypothetical protein
MANSDNDGTAVHNDDDFFRSIGDTFADSHYGYIGPDDTDFCTFYGLYCQRINRRAMLIEGTENTIIGSTFNLPYATNLVPWNDVVGVEINDPVGTPGDGSRNSISDTTFWLSNFKSPFTPGTLQDENNVTLSEPGPATAVRITSDFNSIQNCRFLDFAHPGYACGIHIPSAVEGFMADVSIWGFDHSSDVFLDIEDAGIKGLDITIHGNSAATNENFPTVLNHSNAAQYVRIPSGWDNTNSIRLVNDATGQVLALTTGNAYFKLTRRLVGYWRLNEASGSALDAHTADHDLTDTGGVGVGTGKLSGARDFNGSSQYFTTADNPALSTGDIGFTISCWVKPDSISGDRAIVGKDNSASEREFLLYLDDGVPTFAISSNGSDEVKVASSDGALSTGTWYFIRAWRDEANGSIKIQVDDGDADSTPHAGHVNDSTTAFQIGARGNGGMPFDGLIDEVGFWKRTLNDDEHDALYNDGSGFAYPF